MEGEVVAAVFPHALHLLVLIFYYPWAIFEIVSVVALKKKHPLYVGLPRDVLPPPLTHIVYKLALKTVAVRELKDTLSPHHVLLEVAPINCRVCEVISAISGFLPVFKKAFVVVSVGTELLTFSLRESPKSLTRVPPAIFKKKVCHSNSMHLLKDLFILCGVGFDPTLEAESASF